MNKYLVAGIVALPTYVAGLVGLEAFSLFNSYPVTTQGELEELVVAEKARLECQAPIKPILSFQGTARFLAKDAHGEYTLLVGELGANNQSIGMKFIIFVTVMWMANLLFSSIFFGMNSQLRSMKHLAYVFKPNF